MTEDDLDLVMERTGHERFRWLVSDANPDAAKRAGAWATVAEMAAGFRAGPAPRPPASTPARIPLADALRATERARECPAAGPAACGCTGARSCSKLGRDVTLDDCIGCPGPDLSTIGETP
ncbi:hypothetical protein [Paludisphaera mucosa]|uniref:Uncharacterized protein n=1 Tax=Paludisphaera mucosa TaxID=3030827 RepID=A0ABT6F6V9_9BACT|nr:hypothetical protein [Paludisphaera mucosa]MDG3003257.1 hypothetical protein [Paludisphaera mucosa]